MRVLVIGGTRFVGRHVVEELNRRGHQVTVFHRGAHEAAWEFPVAHLHGERRELAARTAGVAFDALIDMHAMNDRDSRWVVDAFRGRVAHSVHVSSMDVYRAWEAVQTGGPATDAVPLGEEAPLRPTLYLYRGKHPGMEQYDKILMERTVLGAGSGFPATVVRLPMVYGPHDGQRRERMFLRRILDGVPIVMGGGSAWLWHRVFAKEAARAIVLAAESDQAPGHVFNVGEPVVLTMYQWAEAIGRAAGIAADIRLVPDAVLPKHLAFLSTQQQHMVADTTKIRHLLGYAEEMAPDACMQASVTWHLANPADAGVDDPVAYQAELRAEAAALRGLT